MFLFLSFFTLALAGTAVASFGSHVGRRELKMESNLEKRDQVDCSDASQASFLSASVFEARELAIIAREYIYIHGKSDSRVKTYFGAANDLTLPANVFTAVIHGTRAILSCLDPALKCRIGFDAYSLGGPEIYMCPRFYSEVTTSNLCSGTTVDSLNIRGGTVLREVTRVISSTSDPGGGCTYARYLASSNPNAAAHNANNYNCFAQQLYANTQCSG